MSYDDTDSCAFSKFGCKGKPTITYLNRRLCDRHWNKLCSFEDDPEAELKFLRSIGLDKIDGKYIDTLSSGSDDYDD